MVQIHLAALMICEACATDGEPVKECALCQEAGCRHEMRKAQLRTDGKKWREAIVCREWTRCMTAHARRVIRE